MEQTQYQLQCLQLYFRGQMRVQLKQLAAALGVSERTVRNGGNVFRINCREVRPAVVNGRLTYCLSEVAAALEWIDIEAPVPLAQSARGRPRKAGLTVKSAS